MLEQRYLLRMVFQKQIILKKKKQEILVVMGDGALNEGMNFEALNHLKDCKGKIIIIFNDNNYFIDKSVGSIKYMSENFITKKTFKNFFLA